MATEWERENRERTIPLDRTRSVILQAYTMGEAFDVIKDALIVNPTMKSGESLIILPPLLAPLEFTTKAPVWLPLVVWLPVCWALWMRCIVQHSAWTGVACIGACLVVWPLLEYVLHRFIFHMPVAWAKGNGIVNVVRLLLHTVHHAHPTDALRIVTPIPLSGAVALLVLPGVFLACPTRDIAYAFTTGLILGYLSYDMMHYYLHFGRPNALPDWMPGKAWLRRLHKSHANHHFAPHGYRESFGVAHTTWDAVFGTLPCTIAKME